ncbi:hypothetical protein EDD27_8298 [Nonomuraea polychroma]|uniref:Uncharacterized protein n=1 Tax=Nonomuraea polychroma TaxID=46176 RepID=A0A438MI66_9ACTN|nr:acetyltransferase [Nonomuraea polychroma]RVX45494.1 hypothetical protein EDD27_8298 [Nonomuraea polychroma]
MIRDGRYEGESGGISVTLRVDAGGSGVISADVFRVVSGGLRYLASARTAPGTKVALDDGKWPAIWQAGPANKTTGSLALAPAEDGGVSVTFTLDAALNGLPVQTEIVIPAEHKDVALRELGLEIELEEDAPAPSAVIFQGVERTVNGCLGAAGFAVKEIGRQTSIPAGIAGAWDDSLLYTMLSDLMLITGEASLRARAWELHLLLLSRAAIPGLAGVMFDAEGLLQRQGAAVFTSGFQGATRDQKIIRTVVHELGHALNLAHRFERAVGRADSTSFMNYDWRYRGGGHELDYWRDFAFTFDADELAFLRHGPLMSLIPGGEPFHSVRYWADGTGGHSPYAREVPFDGHRLTLTAPAAGTTFAFGQPVFLKVTLENRTTANLEVERWVLDPKSGPLEILVRRRADPPEEATAFTPIAQRCMAAMDSTAKLVIPPAGSLSNNVNLTFGSAGFTFAEPGEYDITPVLGIYGRDPAGEPVQWVSTGESLRIRISPPQDVAEEREAEVLRTPDVGAWFALGGSDALASAREALEAVRERRQAEAGVHDPVVAAIVRTAALDAARPSVRLQDHEFVRRDGNPQQAADLLAGLDSQALRTFDPYTAQQTAALADRYRSAAEQ